MLALLPDITDLAAKKYQICNYCVRWVNNLKVLSLCKFDLFLSIFEMTAIEPVKLWIERPGQGLRMYHSVFHFTQHHTPSQLAHSRIIKMIFNLSPRSHAFVYWLSPYFLLFERNAEFCNDFYRCSTIIRIVDLTSCSKLLAFVCHNVYV